MFQTAGKAIARSVLSLLLSITTPAKGRGTVFRTILFTIFSTILSTIPFTTTAVFAADNPRQTQQELEAVNTAIGDIQQWLDDAKGNYSATEISLRDSEIQLANISRAVAQSRNSLQQLQTELASLQRRRETLEQNKTQQFTVLSQLLRAAYMAGDQNLLKLLFSQEDFSKSARMLHYYRVYSTAQIAMMQDFQNTINDLAANNVELEQKAAARAEEEASLNQQFAEMEQATLQRQLALAELNQDIASRESELEQLQLDQQQLQQLVEEINLAIERIPPRTDFAPFSEQRGRLPLPVAGPIISRFGSAYGDGNLRRQGVTIAVESGTPVQAIHPGRVVFADWLRGAGLLVIVDHGEGFMSLYGGNQALAKAAGDRVNSGDILASSGSNSETDSAGVYFEIRHHGAAQNPAQWLRAEP